MPLTRQSSRLSLFWAVASTIFVALVLTVLPVPTVIFIYWPDWVALVMIYWALTVPEKIGPWVGFIAGTLMEVLSAKTFGVLGLGLAALVFTVNRAHLQLRVLSIWQQMIVVGLFIGIFKLITGWLYGLISGYLMSSEYFYSLFGCMVTWPFLFIVMQEVRRLARIN